MQKHKHRRQPNSAENSSVSATLEDFWVSRNWLFESCTFQYQTNLNEREALLYLAS